jgi:hypothetical protein
MTIPFATSGQLGVDLSAIYVPSATGLYPYVTDNGQFKLGQQVTASDNSVWTYVLLGTGGSTGAGFVMVFDEDFLAVMMSNSVGGIGDKIGVWPGAAAAAGSYGWVQVYGTCDAIQVLASANPNVALASTTTAGALDDSVANPTINVTGIVLTTARAASQGNAPGVLNYPVVGTTN